MVETGASGIKKVDLSAVDQDIIPDVDDTRDLGSASKRWAALYVVLALVTAITIGGTVKLTTTTFGLIINDSTNIQGDLDIDNNLTALNITASEFYFGNGSKLTGIVTSETDPLWTANQSSYFNTTDILGFSYYNLTSLVELDPHWTGNQSTVAFTNIDETFDEKLAVTKNLTLSDDLIMDQDDKINLGAGSWTYNGTCLIGKGSAATLEIC